VFFRAFLFAAWRVVSPEMLAAVHTNTDVALLAGDSLGVTKIICFAEET
jgi:hypothetical protein